MGGQLFENSLKNVHVLLRHNIEIKRIQLNIKGKFKAFEFSYGYQVAVAILSGINKNKARYMATQIA